MSEDFDIYNIRAYFKFADQTKAMMIANKYGITDEQFLEMKKNAGFTNWTKEKRKKKNKKLVQEYKECEIIKVDDDDTMFDSKEIDEILSQIWINIKD
jgi:hypothetical protein